MKVKAIWLLLPLVIGLAGCQERYRYPCQDPENWNNKECKMPFCSANGTCPEDLSHYKKENNPSITTPLRPAAPPVKGDSKC